MNREQAFRLLGLYDGAAIGHVEDKYKALVAELRKQLEAATDAPARAELQGQIDALGAARNIALGKAEDATITLTAQNAAQAAHVPAWRRGPVVLLFLVLALVVCVIGFYLAAHYLDNKQAARETAGRRDRANNAHDAWEAYRKKLGLKQTTDGERAQQQFDGAKQLDDQGDPRHAGEDYDTALDLYRAAFAGENARIGKEWDTQVAQFWKDKLKGRFPFSDTGEIEASAADVATLFNPVSGRVWHIRREYDALSAVQLEDLQVATLPKHYGRVIKQAEAIRDALFGARDERINVMFSVRIEHTKMLAQVMLELGGVKLNTFMQNFVTANWTQDDAGARMFVRKPGERVPAPGPVDYSQSDWGVLQLLNYCSYDGEQDGEYVWSFELEGAKDRRGNPRPVTGTIHIKLDRPANPFDFKTYSEFQPG